MLKEAKGISKIIIAVGYTDLRYGINRLALLIKEKYRLDPFEKNVLFLFCGKRTDRLKAILWEGDGFLLLYKRYESGSIEWPRTPDEAAVLTKEQYLLLMQGFNPVRKRIRDVYPSKIL